MGNEYIIEAVWLFTSRFVTAVFHFTPVLQIIVTLTYKWQEGTGALASKCAFQAMAALIHNMICTRLT